jgi:hypothetical protein
VTPASRFTCREIDEKVTDELATNQAQPQSKTLRRFTGAIPKEAFSSIPGPRMRGTGATRRRPRPTRRTHRSRLHAVTSASRFTSREVDEKVTDELATIRPELFFYGMLGNALDIPGMRLCTTIWAIFPLQFSYSIASCSSYMFTRCISFTVILRTDNECGHRLTQSLEVCS